MAAPGPTSSTESLNTDTIALVKSRSSIPVVANGDIDSAAKARAVLDYTGADAVMIGRAAMGRPWIFREIAAFLATGELIAPPATGEVRALLLEHLADHYAFYGEWTRSPNRSQTHWMVCSRLPNGETFRAYMNTLDSCHAQLAAVDQFFGELGPQNAALPVVSKEERLAA